MQKLTVLLLGVNPEIKAILEEIVGSSQFAFTTESYNEAISAIIAESSAHIPESHSSSPLLQLKKPVKIAEIVEWLQRVIFSFHNSEIAVSENILLDVARLQLKNAVNSEFTALTDKEAKLCETLCKTDLPLSREELLQIVWGYGDNIETRTLETHINRLRRKLEQISENKITINATGGGYVLEPSVQNVYKEE